jgi:hypothetical protein
MVDNWRRPLPLGPHRRKQQLAKQRRTLLVSTACSGAGVPTYALWAGGVLHFVEQASSDPKASTIKFRRRNGPLPAHTSRM